MKVTYIYHSGFCIQTGDIAILIDYYKDTKDLDGFVYEEVLTPTTKKLYILSTHSHLDHFNGEVLNWKKKVEDITYIFSKDILINGLASESDAHYLDKLEEYKDDNIFIRAYGSTDVGGSFYIEVGGKKIFHAGDLNNWHWNEEASAAEIKESEDFYATELAILTHEVKSLDVAMFPIDPRLGKDFTKGAEQFVEAIDVKLLIPMHFDEAYEKVAVFAPIAKENNCIYMLIKEKGQSINI